MFRLTRLPLRRCLHTAAGAYKSPRLRIGLTVGLSAAALAFSVPTFALDSPSAPAATAAAPIKYENAPAEATPAPAEAESEEEKEGGGGGGGGAYNPETGEINWDCPCLGGMAHGPCGPEFREAFSCFVHSDAEPKGINCVEKFQGMQNCFREHPDVYSQELMDDDDDEESATKPDSEDPVAAPVAPESAPVPKKKQDAPSPSS